jgi:hypothetical protein
MALRCCLAAFRPEEPRREYSASPVMQEMDAGAAINSMQYILSLAKIMDATAQKGLLHEAQVLRRCAHRYRLTGSALD